MKISALNLNTITSIKRQNTTKTNFKANFDAVNFTPKTPRQILLSQEAKDLSKEAYSVFAKGKNIQKQEQKYLNASYQILNKAQKIQEKSKKDYEYFASAFSYAKENKLKASADPFKNTQTIYEKDSIEEYRDKNLLRKAIKTSDEIILFEYKNKSVTRSVFNFNGELIEYNENFKSQRKTIQTSDVRFTFESSDLKSCDFGVIKKPNTMSAKKSYQFNKEKELCRYLTNLNKNSNGYNTSCEDYVFSHKKVSSYQKNLSTIGLISQSFDESYIFSDDDTVKYIKNYNFIDKTDTSIEKLLYFKDSKLQKAILDLYGDCNTRLISKYFVYSNNERPQFCYLNHQKHCSALNFDDDMPDEREALIYLR